MYQEVTNVPQRLAGVVSGTPVTLQWLGVGRVDVTLGNNTTFFIWPNAAQTFLPGDDGITVASWDAKGVMYYAAA